MTEKTLFLCNSVYQVLVALWIKYHYLHGVSSDIIISNHMNGGETIAQRIRSSGLFKHVYYAKTLDEARYRVKRTRISAFLGNAFPMYQLRSLVPLQSVYTDLYVANFDGFTQMLFNALSRKNTNLKLHIYEDGLSTYCSIEPYYRSMKDYYTATDGEQSILKQLLHKHVYKKRTTYNNVSQFLVFNPDVMSWDPGCTISGIAKIDLNDRYFRELVNQIFDYDTSADSYNCKYLFFEESFYADGYSVNDVELVEKLATHVGKENIMVKIHPRNPENRFAALGYKTNQNTSIPWEVIMMNLEDISDITFVTIASSAILNPIMVLGQRIKAYSLYPCLSLIPETLQGPSWTFLEDLFKNYSDMITLVHDTAEIK